LASAASAARNTVIPCSSRAAAVRLTRLSSATVPNRRLTDRSTSGLISVITERFLPRLRCYSCACKHLTPIWLHMQVSSETDGASLVERLVAEQLPDPRGLEAWRSLLRAHATLLRQLETDLERETGLALADFDMLAQLG